MSNFSRNLGVFGICLFAVVCWIGGLAFQLMPHAPNPMASPRTSTAAASTTDRGADAQTEP